MLLSTIKNLYLNVYTFGYDTFNYLDSHYKFPLKQIVKGFVS